MRASAVALTALLLGACASQPPAGPHGRPPRDGFGPPGGPDGGPPEGGPSEGGPPEGGRGRGGGPRGRTFISPMGEPFRGEENGLTPAAAWFAGTDTNHDGRITRAEFEADAMRFFAVLDTDHDGEIGPAEIDNYEEVIAPEIRVGGAGGGGPAAGGRGGRGGGGGGGRHGGGGGGRGGGGGPGGGGGGGARGGGGDGEHAQDASSGGGNSPGLSLQGAARFSYLAMPEPVIAADADFNRGVSRAEFLAAARARFVMLDRDGDGVLTEAKLPRLGGGARRP